MFQCQAQGSHRVTCSSPCWLEQAARLDEISNRLGSVPFWESCFPNYYTTFQLRRALAVMVNQIASFTLKFPVPAMSSDDDHYCHQIYQRPLSWKWSGRNTDYSQAIHLDHTTTPWSIENEVEKALHPICWCQHPVRSGTRSRWKSVAKLHGQSESGNSDLWGCSFQSPRNLYCQAW